MPCPADCSDFSCPNSSLFHLSSAGPCILPVQCSVLLSGSFTQEGSWESWCSPNGFPLSLRLVMRCLVSTPWKQLLYLLCPVLQSLTVGGIFPNQLFWSWPKTGVLLHYHWLFAKHYIWKITYSSHLKPKMMLSSIEKNFYLFSTGILRC